MRFAAWLDWLLPPRCGACRTLGGWLCSGCRSRVRWLREPLCARCGREVEFVRGSCACRVRLRSVSRVRSAAAYEGPLETAIHRFKYEGWRVLAPMLAELLVERLSIEVPQAAVVTAVPLHPARQRARGYNQSELLADQVRRGLRLRRPAGHLRRTRNTPPQVGLDRVRRRENVQQAFAWTGPTLSGAHVVLVDDVTTTGATLDACGSALRAAGARTVLGLTVARVGFA